MTVPEQIAMAARQLVLMVGPLLALWNIGQGVDWHTVAAAAGSLAAVVAAAVYPHAKAWRERRRARRARRAEGGEAR